MIDSDDLPVLPIGIAIGVVVILVVLISLALLCSLVGLVNNPLAAGLIGLSLIGFGG